MQSASMTWLKMQISYVRGGSTADAQNVINHARNHGFKVLLSIKGLKSELNANPAQYYLDFAGFLGAVAALNPDAIEVWNEPNIDAEWPAGKIDGTNYTEMLKKAYPAIKQANSNVMVISGAPAPTGFFGGGCATNGCDDKIFIEQMKAAGASAYFDCTGIHYNEGVLPPSASSGDPRGNPNHYTRYYPTMVSTYRTVFPNKPLCFTELGYLTPQGLGSLPPGLEWGANTSAQEQADWLAQAATISRDGGIVRLMVVWNVNATFTSSNSMAGWAIIRTNGQCLPCATLNAAMTNGPHSAPTLIAPANNGVFTNNTPEFSWNSVTDAESYRIQIDSNNNFSSPERTNNQTGTAYAPSPGLPDGLYFWRVRGLNSEGSGPWSSVRRLTIDTQAPSVPTLVSPQNAATITDTTPTLGWTSAGATQYEMKLGTSNPPSPLVFSGGATSYTPPNALAIGKYYWQVRAFDAAGNTSAWSTPFSFTIVSETNAAPGLRYSVSKTITLTWNALTAITQYEVEVDNSPNFTNPVEYETTVSASTLQVTTPALENGTHYWRVRAKGSDGTWGAWSAVEGFQVNG
jgi:hypothetical protein